MSKTKKVATPKVAYDPTKGYDWKPEDIFTLTGQEFGMTLQYLNKRRESVLRELEIITIFQKKLEDAV